MKEIVVVEDNADIREVIEIVLQSDQYSLKTFENLRSFRSYISDRRPDVIVLDVMLPDGDGMNECRLLKADQVTKGIPVVLMSANKVTRPTESGAVTFIDKPFDIGYFKRKVEGYL